jgi:hypothetical protein
MRQTDKSDILSFTFIFAKLTQMKITFDWVVPDL